MDDVAIATPDSDTRQVAVLRPDLAAELRLRAERDAVARRAAIEGGAGWDAVSLVDAENLEWLSMVLPRYGWPTTSLVGVQGGRDVWLLAQHADRDVAFQRRCLALLFEAVEAGQAEAALMAFLTDRVLRAEGRPQRYGTQFWRDPSADGVIGPQPIEDLEGLEARRRAVGLPPFEEYTRYVRALAAGGAPVA